MSELNFANIIEQNENLKPLMDAVTAILEIPDAALENNSGIAEELKKVINSSFDDNLREESIKAVIDEFKAQGMTRLQVRETVADNRAGLEGFIDSLSPSPKKREIIESMFSVFYDIFNEVDQRYLAYDIELPIMLEEGAQVPTYAHDSDVAADLYAAEDIIIKPHTYGNMVRTGVHIGLPEGWVAFILPRSSIGFKTPLRLSNSMGVIDSGYRGPLGVLYDNTSDSEYVITAGDRIAQLLVRPSYRFKAKIVDSLDVTDRNEGGFGSTGN